MRSAAVVRACAVVLAEERSGRVASSERLAGDGSAGGLIGRAGEDAELVAPDIARHDAVSASSKLTSASGLVAGSASHIAVCSAYTSAAVAEAVASAFLTVELRHRARSAGLTNGGGGRRTARRISDALTSARVADASGGKRRRAIARLSRYLALTVDRAASNGLSTGANSAGWNYKATGDDVLEDERLSEGDAVGVGDAVALNASVGVGVAADVAGTSG